mmetsp:Transcript_64203/g.110201  ORF Transcript_64203/g.110201 Transcript_64203/m.110201 type:complete len:259 (+) Transcript_64203:757-1533(+)
MVLRFPCMAARATALKPCTSTASTSTPPPSPPPPSDKVVVVTPVASNRRTASKFPSAAATCRGVLPPESSSRFGSALNDPGLLGSRGPVTPVRAPASAPKVNKWLITLRVLWLETPQPPETPAVPGDRGLGEVEVEVEPFEGEEEEEALKPWPWHAKWMGWLPSNWSLAPTAAPCVSSASTTWSCPPCAAHDSAVLPSSLVASTAAAASAVPLSSKSSTACKQPLAAALMRAVRPSRPLPSILAPLAKRSSTASSCPF